jgi:hypothetical protein
VKEEGVLTLWRGAVPTMGRAMVVNAAQLASYSQAKQFLLDTGQIVVLIAYTITEVVNIFFFRATENLDTVLLYIAKHGVGATFVNCPPVICVVRITEKYILIIIFSLIKHKYFIDILYILCRLLSGCLLLSHLVPNEVILCVVTLTFFDFHSVILIFNRYMSLMIQGKCVQPLTYFTECSYSVFVVT